MGSGETSSSLAERVQNKLRVSVSDMDLKGDLEVTLDTRNPQSRTDEGDCEFHHHYVCVQDKDIWLGHNAYESGTTRPYVEADPRGVIRALESFKIALEYFRNKSPEADFKVKAGEGFHIFYDVELEKGIHIDDAIILLNARIVDCEDIVDRWNGNPPEHAAYQLLN